MKYRFCLSTLDAEETEKEQREDECSLSVKWSLHPQWIWPLILWLKV